MSKAMSIVTELYVDYTSAIRLDGDCINLCMIVVSGDLHRTFTLFREQRGVQAGMYYVYIHVNNSSLVNCHFNSWTTVRKN